VNHKDFHTLEEFVDGIPQNWWSEDTRDKEVVLAVNVGGSCSTQTFSHRVLVHHCYTGKKMRIDSKPNSARKTQEAQVQRSEFRQQSTSPVTVDDLQNLKIHEGRNKD
jgi:hypothetical protein